MEANFLFRKQVYHVDNISQVPAKSVNLYNADAGKAF